MASAGTQKRFTPLCKVMILPSNRPITGRFNGLHTRTDSRWQPWREASFASHQ